MTRAPRKPAKPRLKANEAAREAARQAVIEDDKAIARDLGREAGYAEGYCNGQRDKRNSFLNEIEELRIKFFGMRDEYYLKGKIDRCIREVDALKKRVSGES